VAAEAADTAAEECAPSRDTHQWEGQAEALAVSPRAVVARLRRPRRATRRGQRRGATGTAAPAGARAAAAAAAAGRGRDASARHTGVTGTPLGPPQRARRGRGCPEASGGAKVG